MITGTGFAVPVTPYAIPMVDSVPTVSVTIGGRAVRAIRVISATEVQVLTPRFRGDWHGTAGPLAAFTASDVVLSNLDANGVVVPGEVVTEAGGFTYQRWDIGKTAGKDIQDPVLLRVFQALHADLIRDICTNVAVSTHTDYSEGSTLETVPLADLPYIGLSVDAPRDREYGELDSGFDYVERGGGDGWDEYGSGKTHMLVVGLTLAGEGFREASYLAERIEDFVEANPTLEVDADPVLYAGETDNFDVEISGAPQKVRSTGDGRSNHTIFTMEITVRGIRVLSEVAMRQVYEIADFVYAETTMDVEQVKGFTEY